MYFVLKNEDVRQNLINEILALDLSKGMIVDISDKKRTNPQSNLWHAWVGIMAGECGYTKKGMKITLKRSMLGQEDFINFLTGEVETTDIDTHTLKVKEFTELMDETQRVANEMGIILPTPNYYGVE